MFVEVQLELREVETVVRTRRQLISVLTCSTTQVSGAMALPRKQVSEFV